MDLKAKKCVPCEIGTPAMPEAKVKELLRQVNGWTLEQGKMIWKKFKFKDFKESMAFVNQVAEIAEREGHHPDIFINWNRVKLELTTHNIHGLSENDFIMAAKIDALK